MADLGDLARYMDNLLANNAQARFANYLAIAVADAIIKELAASTPADTGTAISNWRVSLNTPLGDVIPAHVPSPKGRVKNGVWQHTVDPLTTMGANAPDTISNAQNVLQNKQPGQIVYITNNVEYILLLDGGSSDQIPANFVERARIVGEGVLKQQSITIFGKTP